jgi:hypothetical protein
MTATKKTQKTAVANAATNALNADQVTAMFGALELRREDWEENQLRASNTVLYSLLTDCEDIFQETQAFKPVRKAVIETYDAKFGKGTSRLNIMTRIVRLVFGVKNSGRVFDYVKALKVAREHKLVNQTITQFFEANGGVEFVRRNQKTTSAVEAERSAKIKAATDALEQINPIAQKIKINLPKHSVEKNAEHSFLAVLMREEEDGTFSAVLISKRESSVNAMLAEYSAQSDEEREADLAARSALTTKPSRRAAVATALAA